MLLLLLFFCTLAGSTAAFSSYELEAEIHRDINDHKVVLYSKTYCPYSKRIKVILGKYPIFDMKVIELDLQEHTDEMQDYLEYLSGRRTVPQLFIDGRFVGGHDETKELDDEGELERQLADAHAILQ